MTYYDDKPIESAVYYFYKINFNFFGFTGAISDRFLTSQGAQSISVVLLGSILPNCYFLLFFPLGFVERVY